MKDVAVVYHLATGRDGKSYPDAFMNAVVTTRNLLEASLLDKAKFQTVRQHQLIRCVHEHE